MIIRGGPFVFALAKPLEIKGREYILIEARECSGGQIITQQYEASHFSLGAAWGWLGQSRTATLIDQLGFEKFD